MFDLTNVGSGECSTKLETTMIGYGLAFVIGYGFAVALCILKSKEAGPWSAVLWVWGLAFVALNYIATL